MIYSFHTIICCLPPLSEAKGPGIILSVWFSPIKSLLKSISFPLLSSKFCCGKRAFPSLLVVTASHLNVQRFSGTSRLKVHIPSFDEIDAAALSNIIALFSLADGVALPEYALPSTITGEGLSTNIPNPTFG